MPPSAGSRERGSAVVEFALLLPVLLLVLLAAVQVGVIARDRLVLVQAARAGAREAAVQRSEDAVVAAVESSAPDLDPARTEVEIAWSDARGAPVKVTVTYGSPVAGWLAGWLLPDSVTLRAEATMRQEFG